MPKKYFVYISSARDDLKLERKELAKLVTELGAVPFTMDNFDITLEDDRKFIKKAIEEADYFISLAAHRGGEGTEHHSALELEYSRALKAGVPVIGLVIGEKSRRKAPKEGESPAAQKALLAFKKRLESHPHAVWTNLAELKQKALELLTREMNLNPRRGWVPSNAAVEPEVANVLARLVQENELLKSRLKMEGTDIVKKLSEQIRHALKVMAANRIQLSFYYIDGENWENTRNFRYLRLFRLLAPELYEPKTAAELSHFLGNILNPDLSKTVRKDFPTPSNTVKKIMSDFSLLKLVKCVIIEEKESWEMTEYGKEVFAAYRLRQMDRALIKGDDNGKKKRDEV